MLCLLAFVYSTIALGSPLNPPPNGTGSAVAYLTTREFILSLLVLLFGSVVLIIEHVLLKKMVGVNAQEVARIYIVTLVIVGTLFLICSGFNSTQISPALGLFGTISGYLLGRMDLER